MSLFQLVLGTAAPAPAPGEPEEVGLGDVEKEAQVVKQTGLG